MNVELPLCRELRVLNNIVLPSSDAPISKRINEGNHGWRDPMVDHLFPLSNVRSGKWTMLLASFEGVGTAAVEAWGEAQRFQIPYLEHFLAFGCCKQCWKFQEHAPIVLLRRSNVDPLRLVYMGMESRYVQNGRTLYFDWHDRGSHAVRSFLFLEQGC